MATPQITLDDLRVPTSGHFFRLPKALTSAAVTRLFAEITSQSSEGKPVGRIVREARTHGTVPFVASLLCFKQKSRRPSFLPDSTFVETSYGFVLLLEVAGILAYLKKGAANADEWLEEESEPVDGRALTRVYATGAAYEKMSLKRMTVSPSELRACSYEATDLTTTIPNLGLGRSIPRFIRLVHPREGTLSITPGTSRLNKSGAKKGIGELAVEVASLAPQLKKSNKSAFLDAFPIPMDLAQLTEKPTAVLFDISRLAGGHALDGDHVILRQAGKPDADVTRDVIDEFRTVQLLTQKKKGEPTFTGGKYCAGEVVRSKRSFRIRLHKASKDMWVRQADNSELTFAKWLQEQADFSLSFAKPDYYFTQGFLYQTADFENEISLVESALAPEITLAVVTSEKGAWDGTTKNYRYTAGSRQFEVGSIFRFVEDTLCANAEHLLCADLGDEWADYIAINAGTLSFLHCKHGKSSTGASAFHEVIAQAIKNLGRVQISADALVGKIEELEQQGTWKPSSNIPRYHGKGGMSVAARKLIANFQSKREVVLVVTALSRIGFVAAKTAARREPHFIQLVWILAGFIHTCREKGAQPRIVCNA